MGDLSRLRRVWRFVWDRWRVQWAVVRRSKSRWLVWAFAGIGFFDTVTAQFLPRSLQDTVPNVYEIVLSIMPGWSLQTWLLAGLAVLNIATLEFAYRQTKSGARADAKAATTDENELIPHSVWSKLDQIDLA